MGMHSNDLAHLSDRDLAALLGFYADAGVDCMLEDAAIDRFAESATLRSERSGPIAGRADVSVRPGERDPRPMPATPREGPGEGRVVQSSQQPSGMPVGIIPDEVALADARQKARQAATLAELREAVSDYAGCSLKFSAKTTVFADGNPQARVMIVGGAPGREEDLQGLPFVGREGQMLDRMLGAIGLNRETTYLTNLIFWRPPGNRTPTPHEVALCRPFAERHIELVDPEILVVLGNVVTKGLMDMTGNITAQCGTWTDYRLGDRTWPALPLLDPQALLASPAHKKVAWRDLLALKARLDA